MVRAARIASLVVGGLIMAVVVLGACTRPIPPELGGPLPGLTPEQLADFEGGREVFETVFTPETGLGPLFNANSCAECHEDPLTGGTGDEVELHAAIPVVDRIIELSGARSGQPAGVPTATGETSDLYEDTPPASGACDLLADRGGPVFQLEATPALQAALGIEREPVPPEASTAQRTTPDVFGFGLLDAIPDSTLLALADPDDADGDGISGRVNRFFDGRIGRFGRKAFVPSLAEFNEGAFQIEQGITTPQGLDEGTVGGQPIPEGVDPVAEPELDGESVRRADAFVRFLAPPAPEPRTRQSKRGARVFEKINCAACHVPTLRTGPNEVKALAHRKVNAYTDMLLHDMGAELADICFGLAAPSEFRTEPLMGLRLSTSFLHDGRAKTIEEAILLHDGEAAASRRAFEALPAADREALLEFLRKL